MVIKYAVMVLTLVISAGCATTGSHDHSFPVVNGSAPTVSDTQQIADAAVGERVLLDGAAYRVASRYHAASGRECKQLRHEDTGAVRASCESKGQWYLREPLAGLTAVIPQAALALAEEQEAHQTAVKVQVKAASQAYRTYYAAQNTDDEYYLVDHSTFSYLVLPEHGFVEFFRREISPEKMAETMACYIENA